MAIILFVLFNISAAFHGYKFTHFGGNKDKSNADELSILDKASMLFFGVSNPRPQNISPPEWPYITVEIQSGANTLEAWAIPRDLSLGTVILFHGYCGDKESMLPRGKYYRELGYNLFMVDFPGSGGSDGNRTTIGYDEAKDVKACYDYVKSQTEQPVYLAGTSMGAVAIIKAIHDFDLDPDKIILECPFESLLQTSKNRFETMGLPTFPAAHFLVFWGGIQTGFNAFSFEPGNYAKSINLPTLLIYGEQDKRVKRFEIENIFSNLSGVKELVVLPKSGHANFLETELDVWFRSVKRFTQQH